MQITRQSVVLFNQTIDDQRRQIDTADSGFQRVGYAIGSLLDEPTTNAFLTALSAEHKSLEAASRSALDLIKSGVKAAIAEKGNQDV